MKVVPILFMCVIISCCEYVVVPKTTRLNSGRYEIIKEYDAGMIDSVKLKRTYYKERHNDKNQRNGSPQTIRQVAE